MEEFDKSSRHMPNFWPFNPTRGILACVSCADVAHTTQRTPENADWNRRTTASRTWKGGNPERGGTKRKLCATSFTLYWKIGAQRSRLLYGSVKRCSENTSSLLQTGRTTHWSLSLSIRLRVIAPARSTTPGRWQVRLFRLMRLGPFQPSWQWSRLEQAAHISSLTPRPSCDSEASEASISEINVACLP